MTDKPAYVQQHSLLTHAEVLALKQRLVQRREALIAVDKQVAKIVADVKARGQLDNTYFIFVSDNGFMQGEHRISNGKKLPYDPSARVPLIIRGPGFPADYGYRDVTGLQDVTPTILDATGTPLPAGAPTPDGLSLLGLVNGTVTTSRPQLIEIAETANLTDQQVANGRRPTKAQVQALSTGDPWRSRGIVTSDRWKYIEYPNTGETELYDLASDPDELTNLAGKPAYAAKQTELLALFQQYMDCHGDTCH